MSHVHVHTDQRITHIRFARPDKKNALTSAMYRAACDALDAASADPGVRAVVFSGEGAAFTSGNDLKEFMNPVDGLEQVLRFLDTLVRFEKPLIAAVQGLAIGLGTTMILHCDLAYCAPDAVFKLPFVDLGLVPEAGSSMLLPQLIGQRRAAEYLLLADPIPAPDAAALGLVNAVVDDPLAVATAKALILAAKPPAALRASKALMRQAQAGSLDAIMKAEIEQFKRALGGPEVAEAIGAFMAKRRPDFSSFH